MIINASTFPTEIEITENLWPSLITIIAHLIATGIIVVFIAYFIWKPLKKSLDSRTQYIQEQIVESEKLKKEAEINKINAESNLLDSKKESENILSKAATDSYRLKDKIEEQAKKKSQEIQEQAKLEAVKIKTELKSQYLKTVIDTSTQIAEKILEKEIDKKVHEKEIEKFISRLEDETK